MIRGLARAKFESIKLALACVTEEILWIELSQNGRSLVSSPEHLQCQISSRESLPLGLGACNLIDKQNRWFTIAFYGR